MSPMGDVSHRETIDLLKVTKKAGANSGMEALSECSDIITRHAGLEVLLGPMLCKTEIIFTHEK